MFAKISLIASLLFLPLIVSISPKALATKPKGSYWCLWKGASSIGS
jgi:hypothetical protein